MTMVSAKPTRESPPYSRPETVALLPSDYHKVLEIGCGTGIVTLGVASCVESIVATDISPQMIAVAKGKAEDRTVSNVEFHVIDGYALPYDDQGFDAHVLEDTYRKSYLGHAVALVIVCPALHYKHIFVRYFAQNQSS